MKWIDYREQLGIGFHDEQKVALLKNALKALIDDLSEAACYTSAEYRAYSIMTGEPFYSGSAYISLQTSFGYSTSLRDLISKYIAFYNTYSETRNFIPKRYSKKEILLLIKTLLDDLNINYELIEDADGVFIFPKGAKELDVALVSAPLQWLIEYPSTRNMFIKALKAYESGDSENASEIADELRKTLECFFQEFFKSNKSLENIIPTYRTYLKEQNIPSELGNNIVKLLEAYVQFNNNYAKHHDRTALLLLEYILYETGNTIRFLITIKNNKNDP